MIKAEYTDSHCMVTDYFKKISAPDVPVLFNDDGIFSAPSRYLMFCALNDGVAISSVHTYADQLQAFFRYIDTLVPPPELNKKKYSWSDITDNHLFSFIRHKQNQEPPASDKYIGYVINTVFQFYRWAEENGLLKKYVAIYDDDLTYSISAKSNKSKNWVWPYIPQAEHEFQPVPTSEDLERVHTQAIEDSTLVGLRDTLLMTLYERSARRMDALQLDIAQIPSLKEIDDALDNDTVFYLKVIGKGKVKRQIPITPELAEELRHYIDNERAEIVERCKHRDRTYKDPGKIFISYNLGVESSPEYLSSRISHIMRKAGVKGTGHRIRAKGLTDIVAAHDGYDKSGRPMRAEDVLTLAQESAGHRNPKSLQPYLARSRSEGVASRVHAEELSRTLDIKVNQQKLKLIKYDKIKPIVEAIDKGTDLSDILLELLHEINNKNPDTL